MAREGGDEREGERGDKNFVTYSHGGGGRGFFLVHYFSGFFCERDIICIRTQTHKGMLLKYAGGGGGGGGGERGRQKFSHRVMGVGGDLFPMYSMYS